MENPMVTLRVGTTLLPPLSKRTLAEHSPYFKAMFEGNFVEDELKEVELHQVDTVSLQWLVDWVMTGDTSLSNLPSLSTTSLGDLLKVANMLQFDAVARAAADILTDRIDDENCFDLLTLADLLDENPLRRKTMNHILWEFDKVSGMNSRLKHCNSKIIIQILSHAHLNIAREMSVYENVKYWISENIPIRGEKMAELLKSCVIFSRLTSEEVGIILAEVRDHATLVDILKEVIDMKKGCQVEPSELVQKFLKTGFRRSIPLVPCVVGYRIIKNMQNDSVYHGRRQKKTPILMAYYEASGSLEQVLSLPCMQEEDLGATGFHVVTGGRGGRVVATGGEFSLGHSNWQKGVWCREVTGEWSRVGRLEKERRHHSSLVVGDFLYLAGGFGRHRIILNSMERVNLSSGEVMECAQLPAPMYKPAMVLVQGGDRILVAGRQFLGFYTISTDSWMSLQGINIPQEVEFDNAIGQGDLVYLTSAHSKRLYLLDMTKLGEEDPKLVGSFSKEATNTCLVRTVIYNFHSEEFGNERVVECYNTETKKFSVLLKDDCPTIDFPPLNSHGCFPLVHYF